MHAQVHRALVEWWEMHTYPLHSCGVYILHYQGIHHVVGYTYTQWYHLLTQGVCVGLSMWCVMTQIS